MMNIEDIWQQYRSLLHKFLSSKINNPQDVDDLLQTILIKVHKNLSQLNDASSVKPWLMQIASNTITDFYRQQAKHKQLNAADLWYEDDDETEHQLAKCIKPFIDCLEPDTAELLWLVDIQGVAQKHLAETKGIGYSTLKSRIQIGRKRLKMLFEQCCQFELDRHGNAIDCHKKPDGCTPC
ncbi:RNA polymerase sigma factor SigZ [Thalassotalea sp. HSM 43]|uniref:RNA polymerase sigma factor SigZ n=1 Tax=Thalassotalea sp. HSM 43 TaxID=2552945 RepID=UPI0010802AEC|nr:RNA polymerase sigma factor SigZ [Thalassotalea sp. HSM 43]QBY05861.1 RNA polymerase sigma factor SigZ [Thalassotalea sp. HSM 43]